MLGFVFSLTSGFELLLWAILSLELQRVKEMGKRTKMFTVEEYITTLLVYR